MMFKRWLRWSLLFGLLSLASATASADGVIVVCYNWDCLNQQPVSFPELWLRKAFQPLRQAKTPEAERIAATEVVHRFYRKATEQSPIGADEPGNNEDETVNGRMDCIDHSTTTKNILSYLKQRQQLRWHDVGPYAHRTALVVSHYSATLVEKEASNDDDAAVYVIDPWDVPPESLPQLAPVREWAGARFYTFETQHHTKTQSAPPLR